MKLGNLLQAGAICLSLSLSSARLLTVPITPFKETDGEYSLSKVNSIVVDSQYADAVDHDGQTLIPPTLQHFAETFQKDLKSSLGMEVSLCQGTGPDDNSIFLTLKNDTGLQDVAGRWTSEGYSLSIDNSGITIAGASPQGTWWGTRSVIQAAVVGDMSIPQGCGVDAPGWGTRGAFVSKHSALVRSG